MFSALLPDRARSPPAPVGRAPHHKAVGIAQIHCTERVTQSTFRGRIEPCEPLYTALGVLNERELRIIRKRRLAEEGATLESLGSELGISKERVRQIENRALEKIRGAILEEYPEMSSKSA